MWPFLVAAGISALGSALKGASAIQAGEAQQSAEQQTAQRAEEAAADTLKRSQVAEFQASARASAVIAEQKTQTSGSGVDVNTGTSVDLVTQSLGFTELDKQIIRNNALREAYGLNAEAQSHRQRGEYLAAAGRMNALGDFIGGVGNIAGIVGPKLIDKGPA